uniref:EGF-like domain-containing protein n=1 Tax=Panagrolaimus davidi TaxID=227884 RepID=A0A914PHF4_9BILA
MSTMIAVLLIFFMLIHAGSGNNEQCSSSMNDGTNIIIDRYVPLGQHFNFSCDAYERIKQKYLQIISVQWLYRCQKDSFILDNNPNSRFVYDQNEYFLIGYDIQSIHEGILECHVLYKNSLTNESNLESSTINLKVQDCNEKIDSNASHALRNPCQFGQCQVVSAKLGGIKHEKLYCDCFDQYTGLYCDGLFF